jgi:leader peptidase (prepilin peptidase)/N-methyltransferase
MALAPAPALALLSVLPGLAIGSFLGVLVARMPLRRSVVRSRSACMTCDAVLAWYDNIPLLSFALLRGRCRRCRTAIPLREPAVELAGGLVIAGSVLAFGLTLQALAAAVFSAALVVVSATDLERRIVPNRVVLPAFVAVLVLRTIDTTSPEWLLGALGASGFLLLAAIAYPGGMGMGDVKLALLLGAMLGRTVAVALMLATVLAFVPSAVLLLRHRSAARKQAIPFAPFLAAGALIALFAGNWLLDAYLGALT